MKKIIKVCKKHGDLLKKDIVIHKSNKNKNGLQVRCRLCSREQNWKGEQSRGLRQRDRKYDVVSYICPIHGARKDAWFVGHGKCRACIRKEKLKELKDKYPEKHKELYKKEYAKRNKSLGVDGRKLKLTREICRVHGITVDQYDHMVKEQKNRCKICNKEETRRKSRITNELCRLVVDHCHLSGKVRGLLCHNCNLMLGASHDNVETLSTAIKYLKGFDPPS